MLLASWVVVGCTVPFALDPTGVDFAIENVRLAGRPAPANAMSSEGEVTILLRAGRIAAIGTNLAIPPEAERIDGLGLTAWPGFIDAFSDLRQAFLDARRLQSGRESRRRDPAAVARPASDDCLDALIAVLDHQLRVAFAADREGDLRRALALAQEFRFDLVLIGAKEGWKCAHELAA